jgi:hypothetical protein
MGQNENLSLLGLTGKVVDGDVKYGLKNYLFFISNIKKTHNGFVLYHARFKIFLMIKIIPII